MIYMNNLPQALVDIYAAIASHQGAESGRLYRVLKLVEESGEVAQAVIGRDGMNKRKGVTHSATDIRDELFDVALTALVAAHDYTNACVASDFLSHVEKVLARVRTQGS